MKFGSSRDLVAALEEVRLEVQDGKEEITCRVSREALEALVSREALQPGDLLQVAQSYFELLTDKWATRIQLGVCETDGTVLLRRDDVMSARERVEAWLG